MIAAALAVLRARWPVLKVSSLYESAPVGPAQRDFINAAAVIAADGSPEDTLRELKAMERALGRTPSRRRWGPRAIDIDILLWGRAVIRRPELVVPHREMLRRRFVLEPLAEIAPRRVHPVARTTIARLRDELRARCPDQKVNRRTTVHGHVSGPPHPTLSPTGRGIKEEH